LLSLTLLALCVQLILGRMAGLLLYRARAVLERDAAVDHAFEHLVSGANVMVANQENSYQGASKQEGGGHLSGALGSEVLSCGCEA
jgi:hypothetical protein